REPALVRELARVAIRAPGDLQLHRAGSAAALGPYMDSLQVAVNSDFFPVLEFRAPKARFMNQTVGISADLAVAAVPMLEMLSGPGPKIETATPGERAWLTKARRRETARDMVGYLLAAAGRVAPGTYSDQAQ